jgi:hypothetical protein
VRHAATGQCTATAGAREQPMARAARPLRLKGEGDRPAGMIAR